MDTLVERIATLAAAAGSARELVAAGLDEALTRTGARAASFARHHRSAGELEFLLARGEQQGQDPTGKRFAVARGIVGQAIASDRSELVNDPADHPQFFATLDRFSGFSTTSLLVAPLHLHGHVVGALSLVNKPEGFSETDRETLVIVAGALEQQLGQRDDAAALLDIP